MEKSGQFNVPADLPPGNSPRYQLYRRLGGPQNRSGRCGEDGVTNKSGISRKAVAKDEVHNTLEQCYSTFSVRVPPKYNFSSSTPKVVGV
jgi:hypothetical protein